MMIEDWGRNTNGRLALSIPQIIAGILSGCFFLLPVAFWMTHFHPFVAIKDFFFAASVSLAFALFLLALILTGRFSVRITRLSLAVLLYYCYHLVSFLFFPYTDRNAFFMFTGFIVLCVLVSSTVTVHQRNQILQAVILAALVVSTYGMLQFFGLFQFQRFLNRFGRISFGAYEGMRSFSTLGQPNLLGGFCVAVLPLIAVFLIAALRQKKILHSLYFGTGLIAALLALFFSQTRGAWLAAICAFCVLAISLLGKPIVGILRKHPLKVMLLISMLCIMVAVGIFTLMSLARFRTSTVVLPDTVKTRLEYYQTSWKMIRERPLFGRGFYTFKIHYPLYRDDRKAYLLNEDPERFRLEHIHNEHLELLYDGGIVEYVLFLWICAEALYVLFRKRTLIEIGLAASLIGLLCDGLFSQNLRFTVIASLFWMLLGLANIDYAPQRVKQPLPAFLKRPGRIFGLLCVMVLTVFSIRFASRLMHADYLLRNGMLAYQQQQFPAAIDWFRQTVTFDSQNPRARYYLALAYHATEQKNEAQEQYLLLQQHAPNFFQLNFHLGRLALEQQQLQQAKQYFERQLAVNSLHWRSYYQLAWIENMLERPERAVSYLEQIHSIHEIRPLQNNDYLYIQKMLAQLYINLAEWTQALNILQDLRIHAPDEQWIESTIQQIQQNIQS